MKIYLIRHGETEWNKECRLQGQTDIELNEYGRELAAITSEALKDIPFEIIFHSPLNRAEETARILKNPFPQCCFCNSNKRYVFRQNRSRPA